MSHDGYTAKQESGTDSENTGDRRMDFDCCGFKMNDAMAGCNCGSFFRRHPVAMSAILAIMGLAFLAIPAGVILGIIAFFRTI